MNPKVQLDREALAEFCRKWRVRELSIFGSALRDDFSPDSDLDMKEELEAHFGRPVDVVEKEALRNPWRKYEILRTREVLYAA
jgi:predicted nucleotidyltransferase